MFDPVTVIHSAHYGIAAWLSLTYAAASLVAGFCIGWWFRSRA